ncbi:ABC transporter ATP-binding protein (plasmid) [Deinococcus sp. VB343]|uniref:ABC transporter ATP-binding protein n=1 Tax=Deinococcus sp. VB142 TaxID=3112952 RepID=A0AAU6Q8V1_9DEIO
MIEFRDIEVRFGDFLALPNFNLSIREGEFFTFLGPSGCGKTTALRTLAGFNSPSKGQILIGERDVTNLPADKRNIGMVFQNYALFPSLSVYENIAFGLRVDKVAQADVDRQVRQIASQVNLSDEQLRKGVAELSGGQQQRVAIARAIVMRPQIMLLDEPLSNLDAKLRGQLRGQLKELQTKFGMTTVYVTHDQDEALSMSDRIAVLKAGQIEQVGTPQEIYDHPATEFVCTFIGSANRLESDVTQELARQNPLVDPRNTCYVRMENIGLVSDQHLSRDAGAMYLPGRIESAQYHGLHHTYQVNLGSSTVRALIPASLKETKQFSVGEAVQVSFDSRAVMQFRDTRNVSGAVRGSA